MGLNHLGVILDGNRRFAKRLMLNPEKGHEWGYKKIKELFQWCKEEKIYELTLYTFSLENFNRPKKEFDYLMKLFIKAFKELKEDANVKDMKVNFIGRIIQFPKEVQNAMQELMEFTKNNSPFKVNFAMAYSGRAEIVDATKLIIKKIKNKELKEEDLNENIFAKNLYLNSEPDLIIRTSESRLSGFLTYQSTYSELEFLPDKLWPEFSKEDFTNCIKKFYIRQRRFGI